MQIFQGNPPDVVFELQDTVSASEEASHEEENNESALTITVVSSTSESHLDILNRLVLKSDSCTSDIPLIGVEVPEVKRKLYSCEEFVEEVYDNLKNRIQDRSLLDKMKKKIVEGELNFTLVVSNLLVKSSYQYLDPSQVDETAILVNDILSGFKINIFDAYANNLSDQAITSQMEKQNKILKLVTQNIDGLYQRAGVSEDKIIELHGTLHRVKCQQCGFETASDPYFDTLSEKLTDDRIDSPSCDKCGGILEAFECTETSDLMIVMLNETYAKIMEQM